jgi:hypothetical protein
MVDYEEDDDQDVFTRGDGDKTTSAKPFGDNQPEEVEPLDNTVMEASDKMGDEDFAQGESVENNPEGQPKEESLDQL